MYKPFSQACENNKEPIRATLSAYIQEPSSLLEIGSGTGQHGDYMSQHFRELTWMTSDVVENLPGIQAWVEDANRDNFISPMEMNINNAEWKQAPVNYIFSANTAHIMHWEEVEKMFQFAASCLTNQGMFFLYGPFNYEGKFTSESNARFNVWLKEQAPHRAIRDFESVCKLANSVGLDLVKDHPMPANNRLLVWQFCP
ncbi:MAG: class I SAM-dependent methyltransferase [Pseudomonadales bacterium]|nr:class I SAM-dependent methyltransferase [Pseudomonadales bacterium]